MTAGQRGKDCRRGVGQRLNSVKNDRAGGEMETAPSSNRNSPRTREVMIAGIRAPRQREGSGAATEVVAGNAARTVMIPQSGAFKQRQARGPAPRSQETDGRATGGEEAAGRDRNWPRR
jgi:hypothetical protein